jgi:hypothetical protein
MKVIQIYAVANRMYVIGATKLTEDLDFLFTHEGNCLRAAGNLGFQLADAFGFQSKQVSLEKGCRFGLVQPFFAVHIHQIHDQWNIPEFLAIRVLKHAGAEDQHGIELGIPVPITNGFAKSAGLKHALSGGTSGHE